MTTSPPRPRTRDARSRLALVVLLAVVAGSSPIAAQEIFHSTQTANLQTTETLRAGNLLFEISHRFGVPVAEGLDELFGFDGPSNIRFGLSYAPSDKVLLSLLRTNDEDNLELHAKVILAEGGSGSMPFKLGVLGGGAWNSQPVLLAGVEDNELQFYAQLLANVLMGDRLAVGLVPTFLRNPRLRDVEADNAIALGIQAQWYAAPAVSFLAEWLITEARAGQAYDTGTFGVEFETRGHFFKILFTNQSRINATQVLGGAAVPFEFDQLRVGFNITRLLPF